MRSSITIDRHPGIVRAWLVLAPTFIGFYPFTGLINPLWGSLSGWPLYLAARGHAVYGPHPLVEPVAFVAGPIIALLMKIWLSGWLLTWENRWQKPIILVWAVSALFVVPFYDAPRLFPNWPIWCACE